MQKYLIKTEHLGLRFIRKEDVEFLNALLSWAKIHMDTDYIVAFADKNNTASFHVMEHCGMQHYEDRNYLNMESRFYRIKIR